MTTHSETIGNYNCAEKVVLPISPHAWSANTRLQCPTVPESPFSKLVSQQELTDGDHVTLCLTILHNLMIATRNAGTAITKQHHHIILHFTFSNENYGPNYHH